jgi:hypothetical protein
MAAADYAFRRARFRLAQLAEHFHLPVAAMGDLTELQLSLVYEHPRDKDGALVMPSTKPKPALKPSTSYEEDLAILDTLNSVFKLANYGEQLAKLKEKWGNAGQ